MSARKKEAIKQKVRGWTHEDSAELYGIETWGNGYFRVNKQGEVTVRLSDGEDDHKDISLASLVEGLGERGTMLPVLFRFRDLLHSRMRELNEGFTRAIKENNYKGNYHGVYPIKVNQQRQVIEEITDYGRRFHYGLEAGSKPELIAALAYMTDPEGYLICNGYKDDEFVDLALTAQKMGVNIYIVMEMPGELDTILACAKRLNVRPNLGVRVRLAAKGAGHWHESAGDKSAFGLNSAQVIDIVDKLKEEGCLDCLKLLHYHQGSQIPNIASIREGVTEAARVYVNLVKEGAPMGTLDMGGGLAVDYDGSKTNFHASCNYSIAEYCSDIVEVVGMLCDQAEVPHPELLTESGRAIVAYYSVLVFNVLDVTTSFEEGMKKPVLPEDAPQMLQSFAEVEKVLSRKNLQECYNDASYYRDQIRAQFFHGNATLRERGLGEAYYWHILSRISKQLAEMETISEDLRDLSDSLVDFYYGNFSLFQSLPDSWAIKHLFPVMPIHRLDERPTQKAVLSDITCDCDGKVDQFIDREDVAKFLPLHDFASDKDYNIGVFLVGAYQETLGDLHNLFGDTNVVGVHLENGRPVYTHEVEGDTVADVLTYVEFDPKDLIARFRSFAESAVSKGRISPAERRHAMEAYRAGLSGYTYYES